VIFAPGGGGTLKELAVTLVRLSKVENGIEQIVFLDSQYYGGLQEWMKSLPLPASFLDKLFVTDSRDDVLVMGQMFAGDLETAHKNSPRKNSPNYSDVKSRFEYTPPPSPKRVPQEDLDHFDFGEYGDGYMGGYSGAYGQKKPTDPPGKPGFKSKNKKKH